MDASDDETMRTVRPESSPELFPGPDGNIDQVREQRPRYKSWRKKYRKMKARFETTLKENVSMYKTEQRLDGIARRLQEQNDQLLDLLLDLNTSLQLPDSLRVNVDVNPSPEEKKVTLKEGNDRLYEVHKAVDDDKFPIESVPRVREELEERVANDNAVYLQALEDNAPVSLQDADLTALLQTPGGLAKLHTQLGYMSTAYEEDYLRQVDAKLGDAEAMIYLRTKAAQKADATITGKDAIELEMELKNPQSVHNWLKTNKISVEAPDGDKSDAGTEKTPTTAKRGGQKSLTRKIGDKAMERARERDDEHDLDDQAAYFDSGAAGSAAGSARKKKGRDPDESYRPKGSGRGKPKRKREDGDVAAIASAGTGRKKTKTSIGADDN